LFCGTVKREEYELGLVGGGRFAGDGAGPDFPRYFESPVSHQSFPSINSLGVQNVTCRNTENC
jgi:hypothetical protein